jgi:excinuclease ABC subunit C
MINIKTLPNTPGVYLFKNAKGKIIYVGKAVNLKNRVSSYFQKFERLLPKTQLLVQDIHDLDYVRVESEIEALILEANLIKRHKPYYNIRLKDDKDYIYIKITKEDFPTVQLARGKDLKNSKKYYGPFPDGSSARTVYRLLRRLFPFRTCTPGQGKPCFYYHIGLCLGPCIGVADKKTYNLMIRRMTRFLEGHKDEVVRALTEDMQNASDALQFERAGQIKRQLAAIGYVTEKRQLIDRYIDNPNLVEDLRNEALRQLAEIVNLPNVLPQRIECYDNSNIQGTHATSSMVVFINGEADKSHYRKFRIKKVKSQDDYAYMKEVLTRRFHRLVTKTGKWRVADESFDSIPDLIVIDGGKGQLSVAKKVLIDLNLEIPVIALAKRLEEIYLPGNPTAIRLPRDSEALKIVQNIRDEAHRFALGYNRKLRDKALLPSFGKS